MNLRSIVNFGDVINSGIGVNIIFFPDGRMDISYCILKKEKERLSRIESKNGIEHIEELYSHIKPSLEKGVRIFVNVAGKYLLTKTVQQQSGNDLNNSFSKLFSGVKKEEFIIQEYKNSSAFFLTLIRKEDVKRENLLLNNKAYSLSLGMFILEAIAPLLQRESVVLNDQVISFKDNEIVSIESVPKTVEEKFNVGGEEILSGDLLAFAAGVNLFLPPQNCSLSGLPDEVESATTKYDVHKSFFLTGRTVLLSVLVIMVVNAFIFFWLSGEVREAEANLSLFEGKTKKDQSNRIRSTAMAQRYDKIGWTMNRLPLFYADQIAGTVPNEIHLQVLETGTFEEDVFRKEKKYSFDADRIRVSGLSADPASLSKWISVLQRLYWIKGIHDQKYQYNTQQRKGVFEFTIDIK